MLFLILILALVANGQSRTIYYPPDIPAEPCVLCSKYVTSTYSDDYVHVCSAITCEDAQTLSLDSAIDFDESIELLCEQEIETLNVDGCVRFQQYTGTATYGACSAYLDFNVRDITFEQDICKLNNWNDIRPDHGPLPPGHGRGEPTGDGPKFGDNTSDGPPWQCKCGFEAVTVEEFMNVMMTDSEVTPRRVCGGDGNGNLKCDSVPVRILDLMAPEGITIDLEGMQLSDADRDRPVQIKLEAEYGAYVNPVGVSLIVSGAGRTMDLPIKSITGEIAWGDASGPTISDLVGSENEMSLTLRVESETTAMEWAAMGMTQQHVKLGVVRSPATLIGTAVGVTVGALITLGCFIMVICLVARCVRRPKSVEVEAQEVEVEVEEESLESIDIWPQGAKVILAEE